MERKDGDRLVSFKKWGDTENTDLQKYSLVTCRQPLLKINEFQIYYKQNLRTSYASMSTLPISGAYSLISTKSRSVIDR